MKKKKSESLNVAIQIRVTQADRDALELAAKHNGLELADHLRGVLRRSLEQTKVTIRTGWKPGGFLSGNLP